jgi:hypothetical protein
MNHRTIDLLCSMITSITSVVFGLILRLSLDFKEGKLTWRLFALNAIASICLSYLFYLLRRDYKWTISLDLMLFITSLFASFIVSLVDKFGKFGIKNYFLMFIRRYAAEAEVENNPEKHDTERNAPIP